MDDRKLAAKLVDDLYSSKIDFNEFMMGYPDDGLDEDIVELYGIIEHRQEVGRVSGESQYEYDNRIERIKELIKKLKEV